ncbi:hypothetical protein GJ633_06890 [Halorubrum sp. CBA1125]|uniref:hypothetical protein n=1 Tax=Halorubrum sp. CBA1125 TaxID=2668072 RepID=UPI0012E89FFD|nr:hypothetical protein [Halorubrum sp. CBA1125]MUW14422.1 hypothetical protein [Halorubrum sp. CBA1125]
MPGDDYRGRSTRLDAVARDRGRAGSATRDPDSSGDGPRVSRVPESHAHDTFSVEGIDTKAREALLEAVLRDHDGVSAASATERNGTVGIHHDPDLARDDLRETLEACGLVVAPGDEAFEARRAAQFASARVAVAVLFGLMVATPYIAVLYPTRVEWLFYDPVTVAYLQSILESQVATHFFVNLAALSGIAFLVACGPTVRRAVGAVRDGELTNEVAFVGGVALLYSYSTLAAFTAFEGAVHYDLVAYAVVAVTLWTHFGVEDPAVDPATSGPPTADAAADDADEEPVAMTDGGQ